MHQGKVLFLGHEATRTGGPLLLLELIKWLNVNSSIKPSVLLQRGGELEPDYRAVAPTQSLEEEFAKANQGIYRKALRKLRLAQIRRPDLAKLYPVDEYPIVYANTAATCKLASQLAAPGRRTVHHIHELSYSSAVLGATEALKRGVAATDLYIAACHAVRGYLESVIGVPADKIRVVHEFPIAAGRYNENQKSEAAQLIRQRLEMPKGAFVVGMCGSPEWRKGTDLFVQLALHMKRCFAPGQCHFVWLGGNEDSQREALHDVGQTGLQNICHFIPAVANPEPYFGAFDVFALTSREEPFSLAMLEGAASGLPIVCFAGAGGASELVESDAGLIVPYLDVPAMAKACVDLLQDKDRRRQLGENARAKVRTRYMLELQGPKILSSITGLMN